MTERGGGLSPKDRLKARMDELEGRLNLAIVRVAQAKEITSSIKDEKLREEVGRTRRMFEVATEAGEDVRWLLAIMGCGVSEELLLRIWDRKDEINAAMNSGVQEAIDELRDKGFFEPES